MAPQPATLETAEALKKRYGKKVGISIIGPAGEQKLASAGILNLDKDGFPTRINARGGLGAVELAARVEQLRFQPVAYPGTAFGFPPAYHLLGNADRVTTIGVNWYVNHYLKVESDFINETVEDPARSPAPSSGGRFGSAVFLFQFRM